MGSVKAQGTSSSARGQQAWTLVGRRPIHSRAVMPTAGA
jgi:hypothetical protein